MEISFVVPMYNAELYIEQCIESILYQRGIQSEILLIDDGSEDRTLELCHRKQQDHDTIRIYTQEHLGASEARNRGLREAKNNWICFVDADDYLEENAFEGLDEESFRGVEVCFFDYAEVNGSKVTPFVYSDDAMLTIDEEGFRKIVLGTLNKTKAPRNLKIATPWAKLYNRAFLMEHGLSFRPGIRKSQDLLFNFETYRCAKHGLYVRRNLYYYRYNPESLCNKYMDQIITDYSKQLQIIQDILEQGHELPEFQQDWYIRGIINFINALLLDYCHKDNPKPYAQRKQEFLEGKAQPIYQEAFESADSRCMRRSEQLAVWCIRHDFFRLLCVLNQIYSSRN